MSLGRRAPDVDYLTRDYEGFRQLLVSLVDRAGTRWTERATADLGVMVLEMLAHQLDLLAYAGDRVAEEGFLGSARRRESLRRHAALGDYRLDRGNATRGYQHFRLQAGVARTLPAGTQVGQEPAPGQPPEQRLVAETLEDVALDARRNELALTRSAAAGSAVLRLAPAVEGPRDLRAIGLRPGMLLAIVDREQGEIATVASVQAGAVELRAPLGRTYLAGRGKDAARVLGNIAPIRRGRTSGWELVDRGGKALGEVPPGVFLARRIDQVRALRDEVEAARARWLGDRALAERWEIANATVDCVVRELRVAGAASVMTLERAKALDEQLRSAAQLFREMLQGSGRAVPGALQPTRRVPMPRQEIALQSEQPPLWADGVETLKVRVGVAGRWAPWTEVDDLLRSGPDDRHYVAEIDGDGQVTLRFGDGVNGAVLPGDSRVMVQRVTGDVFAGDVGAHALRVVVGGGDGFDPEEPTTNPLPTTGGRPLEVPRRERGASDGRAGASDDIAQRMRRALSVPVVPVTAADYTALLEARPDIAEAAVSVSAARRRVDVVLRPSPGHDPARALEGARAFLRDARLAGTDAWARLAEPLYVAIALIVEIHPEISPADLRSRLRRALLSAFGDGDERILGRRRARAEVYAAVEAVAGVVWSQVVGFSLASQPELTAQEEIVPGPHEVVRCLDLPDSPLAGRITIWAARRYRLQIEVAFPDPDDRPGAWLSGALMALLSGPDAAPARERWPEITAARLDALFQRVPRAGEAFRLSTRRLMIGGRAVDRVPLADGELPIVDSLELSERVSMPHFGLQIELVWGGGDEGLMEALRARIQGMLSGPGAVPVAEGWTEITVPRVNGALEGVAPPGAGYRLSARMLTLVERRAGRAGARVVQRAVERVPLRPGDVPVLETLQIAVIARSP
ncbi:hypothetical protein BE21_49870 [Sorangium cellulosum]|uniref:Baseplate protein J-like domain-containing protein n=1 Tax=Sorangium cellulosum TaxID=56 RepID=A0A150TGL4_SORCE|nr:hypothetical protein BE21_49870 [Sorangium cellulosum]